MGGAAAPDVGFEFSKARPISSQSLCLLLWDKDISTQLCLPAAMLPAVMAKDANLGL